MRAVTHRVLLTAFEPFVGNAGVRVDPNPSHAAVMEALHELAESLPDLPVHVAVLPVSFRRTRETLAALLAEVRPTVHVGVGAAIQRQRIEVEMVGLNLEHASGPDADGDAPTMRPIEPGAPLALPSPIRLSALASELAADGHPIGASMHAGTFLCNQVLYLGLLSASRGGPASAFVHVPGADVVPSAVAGFLVSRLVRALTEVDT
ncbi:MAG: pyroglutamyl-peptidase I [Myxococcales bacterium]|nr:pyroglutamyl-peptidase I [Myxococcales bacterium]